MGDGILDEVSRSGLGRYRPFFDQLGTRLEDARRSDRRRYLRFFAELSPRLETAKALERDLDRHLARRFNVFDYLNTLEAGLSQIIADLLNPGARHGQGSVFLATLLEELTEFQHLPDLSSVLPDSISVVTERVIPNKRRLDISVEIPGADGAFCLAIENKPYAEDQPNQIRDYLAFLDRRYSGRFLLIYLSPTGEGPEEWSISRRELLRWEGLFAIMAYRDAGAQTDLEDPSGDPFDDFRVDLSLADWFTACRRRCDPDRLRWFLRDAEAFCQQRFGGHSMPSDSETRATRDYLFANADQLATAQAVHDAWPAIKTHLCERFLEHLRTMLHRKVKEEFGDDARGLRVECQYAGEKGWGSFLWLYRTTWSPWENHGKHPPYQGCTGVVMQNHGHGPNGWVWGVLHPMGMGEMTSRDKERRARLEEDLRHRLDGGQSMDWWPYLRSVGDRMANWNSLLPDLLAEWKNGGGPITDHYVAGMMEIATKAVPIIDEMERG